MALLYRQGSCHPCQFDRRHFSFLRRFTRWLVQQLQQKDDDSQMSSVAMLCWPWKTTSQLRYIVLLVVSPRSCQFGRRTIEGPKAIGLVSCSLSQTITQHCVSADPIQTISSVRENIRGPLRSLPQVLMNCGQLNPESLIGHFG